MDLSTDNSTKAPRLPLLELEEEIFLGTILTSNGANAIAKKIYEILKDNPDISPHLKALYKDGLYGINAKVKRRLRNRMYAIRRINKNHPNVKQLDLLHARDYAGLDPKQLTLTLKTKKDEDLGIQYNMLQLAAKRKGKHLDEEKEVWGSVDDEPQKMCPENALTNPKKKAKETTKSSSEHESNDRQNQDVSKEVEIVSNLFEESDNNPSTSYDKDPVFTSSFRNYFDLESGEEILSEIDEETWKEMEGEYLDVTEETDKYRGKTYDSRPRDKFKEEINKKREMQKIAEEWLEEKRKKTAMKEKAKRTKSDLDISMSSDEEDVVMSFKPKGNSSSSDDDNEASERMEDEFKKCTKIVNEVVMDQMAYIRACADQKKLDLNKYKKDIKKEMQQKDKKSGKCKSEGKKNDSDDESDSDCKQSMSLKRGDKLDRFDEARLLPKKEMVKRNKLSLKKRSAQMVTATSQKTKLIA